MNLGNQRPIGRVLCLGAHSDDIEIGCGGTILRLIAANPKLVVRWQVFSASGPRRQEARSSAAAFLAGVPQRKIVISKFRESYFPQDWSRIKDEFEKVKSQFEPDLVLTHWRNDRHQDHRVVSDLTWNTFRNHLVLEYEIPKYDGDLGQPNLYVAIDETLVRRKVELILRHFQSQGHRHWFTGDTFRSLMRLRGVECGPRTRYAEAFHSRKLVV